MQRKSYRRRASARRRYGSSEQTIGDAERGRTRQDKEQQGRVQRVLEFQSFGKRHYPSMSKKYLAPRTTGVGVSVLDQVVLENNQLTGT
jgi:hypothetical protein